MPSFSFSWYHIKKQSLYLPQILPPSSDNYKNRKATKNIKNAKLPLKRVRVRTWPFPSRGSVATTKMYWRDHVTDKACIVRWNCSMQPSVRIFFVEFQLVLSFHCFKIFTMELQDNISRHIYLFTCYFKAMSDVILCFKVRLRR